MIKKLITEISEEDFRKLNLKVSKNERVVVSENVPGHPVVQWKMVEVEANEILDREINEILMNGYEEEQEWLTIPVTLAVHESGGYYLDKFMNRYTGSQTFQLAFGITHLYSTRDYYEARDDYWRVRKDETKVIYRIKLSDDWSKKFELKHKTDRMSWPYDKLPEDVSPNYVSAELIIGYYKDKDGTWKESYRTGEFKYESGGREIIPVDKNGNRVKPEWVEPSVGDPCSK